MNKKAFTLAEVLITLGVIGIVAALTMPALIANYQKKVLETRIKKFYSVINQAINTKIAEDDAVDSSMINASYDVDQAEEFWNVNYASFLRTVSVKKGTSGMIVAFSDGSGAYVYTYDTAPYFRWCVDYKSCDLPDGGLPEANPKQVFQFIASDGIPDRLNPAVCGDTDRACYLARCSGGGSGPSNCSRLLYLDGWEIKDDYPW